MDEITQQILALAIVAAVIVIALLRRQRKRRRSANGGNQGSNTEKHEAPVHFSRTRKRSKK